MYNNDSTITDSWWLARLCTFAFASVSFSFLFLFAPPDTLYRIFVEEMKERVRESQDLPPVYQSVVARCQIAIQFHEQALEETKLCEQLVHDQHLQKQGWSAVIANLEDITLDITRRADAFEKNYNEYLEEREQYAKLVERFVDIL